MVIAAAAPQWYHNSSSWRYIEEKTSEESWDNPEETKRRQAAREEWESENKDLGAMTRGTTRPIILHGNVGPGINTRAKRRKE